MHITDKSTGPRGDFELRVYRAGELVEAFVERNLVVDKARDSHARLIGGDGAGKQVNRIAFGTNGAGPYPADTAISAAYTKALSGHSYPAGNQVRFDWALSTAEANGKQIREFGLICADGTLYARKTRAAIEKTDDMSLEGSWTITF
ncbi:hypothetical protein EGI20_12100 [Aquitalea sp. S1-19]|nr:hypothetical protein [Aquitalea sp. S1-19]